MKRRKSLDSKNTAGAASVTFVLDLLSGRKNCKFAHCIREIAMEWKHSCELIRDEFEYYAAFHVCAPPTAILRQNQFRNKLQQGIPKDHSGNQRRPHGLDVLQRVRGVRRPVRHFPRLCE
ncbi:Hypothetical_protein [Hexamita inflata]|uniref:Hypothetical_protein n=1 Tax=Hexamita inflata TaxID=28002 RepID=A0ABP1JEG3_9EUKA